jgi:preprotein translocase subunit SecG
MTFVIGLLTFVLVLICFALILLVLIQLPKKEAGAGLAFGGAATDALFGAGSGTVMTKATKYFAITFFILAILVGFLQSQNNSKRRAAEFQRAVEQQAHQQAAPAPASAPAVAPSAPPVQPTPAPAPAQK